MTQDSALAASEDSRHPASFIADLWTPHCIDASSQRVQTTNRDPMPDRLFREPEPSELIVPDHPVLPPNQPPSSCAIKRLVSFSPHRGVKSPNAEDPPPYPACFGRNERLDHAETAADAEGLPGHVAGVVGG